MNRPMPPTIRERFEAFVEKSKTPDFDEDSQTMQCAAFISGAWDLLKIVQQLREGISDGSICVGVADEHLDVCFRELLAGGRAITDRLDVVQAKREKPLTKMMPTEIADYMQQLHRMIQVRRTPDYIGSMVIIATEPDNIRFASSIHNDDAAAILRKLADTIEATPDANLN